MAPDFKNSLSLWSHAVYFRMAPVILKTCLPECHRMRQLDLKKRKDCEKTKHRDKENVTKARQLLLTLYFPQSLYFSIGDKSLAKSVVFTFVWNLTFPSHCHLIAITENHSGIHPCLSSPINQCPKPIQKQVYQPSYIFQTFSPLFLLAWCRQCSGALSNCFSPTYGPKYGLPQKLNLLHSIWWRHSKHNVFSPNVSNGTDFILMVVYTFIR